MQLCENPGVSTALTIDLMGTYKNYFSPSRDKRVIPPVTEELYESLGRQLRWLPQSLDVAYQVSTVVSRVVAEGSIGPYEKFRTSTFEKSTFPVLRTEIYESFGKTAQSLPQYIEVIGRVSTGISRALVGMLTLGESPLEEIKYLTLTDMALAFDRSRVETNSSIFQFATPQKATTIDKFKDVVGYWHARLAEHHFNGINRRLEYLFEEEPEIGNNKKMPSISSFCVLMTYIANHPEFKTPSIGYNLNGSFWASWSGGKKLRVTFDFLSTASVRWTFVDSQRGIENAITGAGVVPLDILQSIFDSPPYNASTWMKI